MEFKQPKLEKSSEAEAKKEVAEEESFEQQELEASIEAMEKEQREGRFKERLKVLKIDLENLPEGDMEKLRDINEEMESQDAVWAVLVMDELIRRGGQKEGQKKLLESFGLKDIGLLKEIAAEKGIDPEKGATSAEMEEISSLFQERKKEQDIDITSEEIEKIFEEAKETAETIEKREKLESALNKWMDEMGPHLEQRRKHLESPESITEQVKDDVKLFFNRELREITDKENMRRMKENASKTLDNILNEEEYRAELDILLENQFSEKYLFDLLRRKLNGEVSLIERNLLDILSYSYYDKRKLGSYDPVSGKVEIFLLNSENLEDYTSTLMHEFTHKALSDSADEIIKKKAGAEQIDVDSTKILAKELDAEKTIKTEKVENLFVQALTAINESFAHIAEGYYGRKEEEHEPNYDGYQKVIPMALFKGVYERIKVAAKGKSSEEFDRFAIHIHSFFAENWREGLSPDDVFEIEKATVKEIDKFKEK